MESLFDAYFLNVGQGDSCVLIHSASRSALVVDCPIGRSSVVHECLKRCHQPQVLGAVVTHFDLDHYAGIVELVHVTSERDIIKKLFCAGRPILPEDVAKKKRYRMALDILSTLQDKGLILTNTFSGTEVWSEGNLHISALFPSPGDATRFEARSDINNSSLILMIKFGSNRILLTGDLESEGWKKILGRQLDIKAQILKFPHHGAWKDLGNPNNENGIGRRIIKAIEPEIIIFSVGTNNINHHPKADSMLAVRKHNHQTRIICTQGTTSCVQNHFPARKQISAMLHDECRIGNEFGSEVPCAGTIIVRFDEKSYWVEPTIAVHDEAISLYQAPMCRIDLQKLSTLVTLLKSSF